MVWKYFARVRYLVIVASVSSLIGSALMFFIGVEKTISAFVYYYYGHGLLSEDAVPEYLTPADLATVSLAQAIDVFLFALVMLIFAYGILYLFLIEEEREERTVLFSRMAANSKHLSAEDDPGGGHRLHTLCAFP